MAEESGPDVPQRAFDSPAEGRPRRGRRWVDPWAFPASIGWSVVGTFLPGAGLLRTRWKKIGLLVLLGIGLVVSGVGLTFVFARDLLVSLAVSPSVLRGAWISLIVVGVLWALSIVATHLALRPRPPAGWQRLLGALVVAVLTLSVTAPAFVGARTLYDTESLIANVFTEDEASPTTTPPFGNPIDPWANKPRLNVLVLGGDSGQSRAEELGARTDTVILASINTRSGDTTLFSLPRQTQRMPFAPGTALAEKWPEGFTSGRANDADYFLNSIYHNVPMLAPEALPSGVRDPAAEVLKQTVGTALGLQVDYYAMVDMDGFIEFINALGGVTVNINHPVAVGGVTSTNTPPDRWLPPGPNQHLNGWDALWFARGRYGESTGDYARMSRQRCLIQAVVQQANPTTVLANYEALSKAGRRIVATDVPNGRLPAMLTLAMRVKDKEMTSVSFENEKDGFSTVRPDWDLVRARVGAALNPPAPTASPTPSATPSTPAATATAEPTATPSATPPAVVVDECAYNPQPLTPTPSPAPGR